MILRTNPRWLRLGPGTVRARALEDGMDQSELVSNQYVIHAPAIELFGFLNFGQVAINESETRAISIRNEGDMPLTITSIAMEEPMIRVPATMTFQVRSNWGGTR